MNAPLLLKFIKVILVKIIIALPFCATAAEQEYSLNENIENSGFPLFLEVLKQSQARAFIRTDNNRPSVIGFRFPASMIAELPAYPGRGLDFVDRSEDGRGYSDQILCSPSNKCAGGYRSFYALDSDDQQPFEVIQYAWNPGGYADPRDRSPYATALMGVHFYITGMAEIDRIKAGDYVLGQGLTNPFNTGLTEESYRNATKEIPSELLPSTNFRQNVFAVPRMGAHHPDASALLAANFTGMTLVYGGNDGRVIFLEPIIFRTLLDDILVCNSFPYMNFGQQAPFNVSEATVPSETRDGTPMPADNKCANVLPRVCQTNPLPSRFIKGGFYPNTYCLTYDPQALTFEITLEDLVMVRAQGTDTTTEASGARSTSFSVGLLTLLAFFSTLRFL